MRKLQWLLTVAILLVSYRGPGPAIDRHRTRHGARCDASGAAGRDGHRHQRGNRPCSRSHHELEGVYVAARAADRSIQGRRPVARASNARSRTDVMLRVADDFAIDFELAAGDVNETVTVEASSTPVKVLGGDVSGVITGEQVRELPLNGRNFLQLATLMPGVSAPDFLNVKDKGLLGGSDLSVSGSDVTANMWTVDGANNNDVGSNRTILVYPSLEAIQEFKILRNSYGPEFGGAGGAQINIVTRGGIERVRRHRRSTPAATMPSTPRTISWRQANQPKEELKRNDFGGTFGGPIIRNKLHFFLTASGTSRIAAPRASRSCPPTPSAMAISAVRDPRLRPDRRSIR